MVFVFFLYHLTSSLNYQGIMDFRVLHSMKKYSKNHLTSLEKKKNLCCC